MENMQGSFQSHLCVQTEIKIIKQTDHSYQKKNQLIKATVWLEKNMAFEQILFDVCCKSRCGQNVLLTLSVRRFIC